MDPDGGGSEPFGALPAQGALFGAAVSPDGSFTTYAQPAEGEFGTRVRSTCGATLSPAGRRAV